MAIIKTHMSVYGVSGDHWKLASLLLNRETHVATITFNLYANTNGDGWQEIASHTTYISSDMYPVLMYKLDNYSIVVACEDYVLSNDEFFESATTQND